MALKPAHLQWSDKGDLESLDYGDVYFQRGVGFAESDYVFLQHNNLPARLAGMSPDAGFNICELGFGTGMNFLLTAALFLKTAPATARLHYVSIEKHPIPAQMLADIYAHWPQFKSLTDALLPQYPPLIEGFHTLHLAEGRIRLILALGDVADMLPETCGQFDAWYLDGFSPAKNPDMWQQNLFPLIARRTRAGGTLATFSVAGPMRRALTAEGFTVRKVKGFGIKWSMTAAALPGDLPAISPRHIAVIGAGIAGCATAHALALHGQRVTLIDRHDAVATETSGNPVGIVYPKMTADPSHLGLFHQHGFCYTRNLLNVLKPLSWQACGVMHRDTDAAEADRHQAIIQSSAYPDDYAVYKPHEGLWQQKAGFLSPPDFCRTLVDHPQIQKVAAQVTHIDGAGADWHIHTNTGEAIRADIVVIAAALDSPAFAQTAWLPLQSLRGQVTMVRASAASAKIATVQCHEGYITPAIDGIHCIGATFQKEPHGDTTARAADDLLNITQLHKHLPEMHIGADHIVGQRAGFRAATPDKIPLCGPCPDYAAFVTACADLRKDAGAKIPAVRPHIDGLYVCTGFGAHGMTGAPLAGDVIASMISGAPLPVPQTLLDHLLPERFILRDLKRNKI